MKTEEKQSPQTQRVIQIHRGASGYWLIVDRLTDKYLLENGEWELGSWAAWRFDTADEAQSVVDDLENGIRRVREGDYEPACKP